MEVVCSVTFKQPIWDLCCNVVNGACAKCIGYSFVDAKTVKAKTAVYGLYVVLFENFSK